MQRTKTVTLSDDRQVTLGVLTWAGYIRLKNEVIERLGGALGTLLGEFLQTTQGELAFTPEVTAKYLPRLLCEVNQAIDDATPTLIMACNREDIDLNSMSPVDILELRDTAASLNDLPRILEKEKNCFAAALGKAATFFQSSPGTPNNSGGPDTNQS